MYVSTEQIAMCIDQLEVWSYILGFNVDYNMEFCTPFRPDNNPKCKLVKTYKWVFLQDFAYREFNNRTIIHGIMLKEGLSFMEACKFIWDNFRKNSKPKVITNEKEYKIKKEKPIIHFKPHTINSTPTFIEKDKKYWKQFGITSSQLKSDYVYSVAYFVFMHLGTSLKIYPEGPCYAYTFSSGNVKIYQPYNDKFKWLTNVDERDIGGLDKLKDSEILFICKSYKDWRIQVNMGFNAIWLNAETFLIPDDILTELTNRFKKIYIYYDNDDAGINGAIKLAEYCKSPIFTPFHLPRKYQLEGITDSGEYVAKYGIENLIKEMPNDAKKHSQIMASSPEESISIGSNDFYKRKITSVIPILS